MMSAAEILGEFLSVTPEDLDELISDDVGFIQADDRDGVTCLITYDDGLFQVTDNYGR